MPKKQLLLLLLFIIHATIFAQKNNYPDSNKINNLQEIVITGSILKTLKITKNGFEEMNLPQAMSVLNAKLLQNQQINSLSDILKNINGLYIMGTTGGYQEEIASRGYNISSTNTFKNGIRFFNGMKLETSGIEKVEFLKGNTAIDYGNVTPGGLINIITKKPSFKFGNNYYLGYGSFDNIKPQFDIYGPINKKLAYRINGSFQQANSFRKFVHNQSFYINPSLFIYINKKSSLLIEGDYTNAINVPDFGAGIINYNIVTIPISRFTGVSWGKYNANQTFISAKYTYNISNKWLINALLGYRNYNTYLFSNTRPNNSTGIIDLNGIIDSNGNWKRSLQKTKVSDNYLIQQIDANKEFNIGKINNKFLIGTDLEQFINKTTAYNIFKNYDQINIFNEYNPAKEPIIPKLSENILTDNKVFRMGIYAQNLISFPKYFKILLGGRYNYIKSKIDLYTYSTKTSLITEKENFAFSPKIGIIFEPFKNHILFASYSNSFTINSGVDIFGNTLNPSIIDQYEIGIKNRILNNTLQLNATIYLINNNNLAQTSLLNGNTNSNIKELVGAIQSKGLELDITYKPIKNINVLLGYSFNNTVYTSSNTYIVGSEILYTPKNTANTSFNYEFINGKLKNVHVGFVCQYFGTRFAGRSTRINIINDNYKLIPLNDYVSLDIIAGYKYKKWSVNGKIANILNQVSYNVHDDNSLNPISPINFYLQIGIFF